MFLELTFGLIMSYGAFPGLVVYLMYIIVKDYRDELKSIQKSIDDNARIVGKEISEQNEALNALIDVTEKMQNAISNQMHGLLTRFIDMSIKKDGGDK